MPGQLREAISTDVLPGVVYQTIGHVPSSARAEAEHLMASLTARCLQPVHGARVKIKEDEDRDPDQRAVVEASIALSGATVRAQAAGSTPEEGLRAAGDRLECRLEQLGDRSRGEGDHGGTNWRGEPAFSRPSFYSRPPEDRLVVRRKTYSPWPTPIDEALFDLEVLDHRFFLFADEMDGTASVVYEADGGVALRRVDGSLPAPGTAPIDLEVGRRPAATSSVSEIVAELDESDSPFAFFVDSARASASALYRRYDGHYGLIVPCTSESPVGPT